jgi:hypothetical protein
MAQALIEVNNRIIKNDTHRWILAGLALGLMVYLAVFRVGR